MDRSLPPRAADVRARRRLCAAAGLLLLASGLLLVLRATAAGTALHGTDGSALPRTAPIRPPHFQIGTASARDIVGLRERADGAEKGAGEEGSEQGDGKE